MFSSAKAFASKNIESDVIDDVMTHSQFRDAYREAQATNNLDPNKLMDMPDLPEGRNSPIGGWSKGSGRVLAWRWETTTLNPKP